MDILRLRSSAFCLLLTLPFAALAQVDRHAYDAVKDSVVSRFNRGDFKGIYGLFTPDFQQKVSEGAVLKFLKSNQNSGRIRRSIFRSEKDRTATYLLSFDLRDMLMDLELNQEGKISGFGLKNLPPALLEHAPILPTNNPKISQLDLAVDAATKDFFLNPKATSLTIGIIKDGVPSVYHYGKTDARRGHVPDNDTRYEIGSVTKTFTATLLAQAVLDGKLKLSDDVRKYLEGDYSNLELEGIPITLQDLANHTSGLPEMPPDIGERKDYDPLYPEAHYPKPAFDQALHAVVLASPPGKKFVYSNWGMALLGHVLERVYGKPEAELLKAYVTGPLGMSHTTYAAEVKGANVAWPHAENGRLLKLTDQGYFYPAGGLCSSSADLMRYLQAQLDEKLPSVELTHRPTMNDVGLSWGVRREGDIRNIQHNGSEQGANANMTAYPEIRSGCFIVSNSKANIGPVIVRIQQILKGSPIH